MKILAIDPGNTQSAFVVLESLCILDKGILPNLELLQRLGDFPCEKMVIEMVASFGMPVGKEVFETVFWIGRFCQAWPHSWKRLYRQEIKLHLCGSPRAKDGNVRQALLDKVGLPGTIKAKGPTYGVKKDIWSALAVGVTWIEIYGKVKSEKEKESH